MSIDNTTPSNGSEEVESSVEFVEYQIANWLWLYTAPVLLIIGLAGKSNIVSYRIVSYRFRERMLKSLYTLRLFNGILN